MSEIDRAESKRLAALARASEVYVALEIIQRYRMTIRQALDNHNPGNGDNSVRRDCGAFHRRLRELALDKIADEEARHKP